jgi:MFS family permease
VAGGRYTGLRRGRYVDRAGPIRGIAYGTAFTIVSIVLFLFASQWEVLVPGQALRTVGFALLNPGLLVYVTRLAPSGHRAEYLGVFSLINSTSWSAGPLMGGLAFSLAGPAGLFGFALGTSAISIVAVEGIYGRAGPRGTRAAPIR